MILAWIKSELFSTVSAIFPEREGLVACWLANQLFSEPTNLLTVQL